MSDKRSRLARADLKHMSAEEIAAATRAGELAHLLNPRAVTADDLHAWDDATVAAAVTEGRLANLGVGRDGHRFSSADQGARGEPVRVSRERLRGLSSSEIAAMTREGRLDDLLRGEGPQPR